MNVFLVPYLAIGGTRETFWKLTPKTIQYDFKAYEKKMEHDMQLAWLNGFYFQQALQSSILACSLADRKTASKMPDYPEMPASKKEEPKNEKFETEFWVKKMDRLMDRINNKKGG